MTVYAHFPSREALLEAVVGRVVRQATEAIEAAGIDDAAPLDALERLVAAAWQQIERNRAIAHAASQQLGPAAVTRSHRALHAPLAAFVRRG